MTEGFSRQLFRKNLRFFYRFYNNYDKIVIPSEDTRNDLIHTFKIEPRKLAKIHNPVDFDEMDCKFSDVRRPHF